MGYSAQGASHATSTLCTTKHDTVNKGSERFSEPSQDVRVARDPAAVRHTRVHIPFTVVERDLVRVRREQQVAASGVEDSLWLPRRPCVSSGSREQGAGSREQGAGSREQGAGSREQGAGSREQGAGRDSWSPTRCDTRHEGHARSPASSQMQSHDLPAPVERTQN